MNGGKPHERKRSDTINAVISGIPQTYKAVPPDNTSTRRLGITFMVICVLMSFSIGISAAVASYSTESEDVVSSHEAFREPLREEKVVPSPQPASSDDPVPDDSESLEQQPESITVGIPEADLTNVEYTGPTEGVQERLNRLAQSLGITYPVVATDCYIPGQDPTSIRGCYFTGTFFIGITKYALIYDDTFVSCVIRHEARHLWQDLNGLFQIQNGEIVNREWLEADATAYSGCS